MKPDIELANTVADLKRVRLVELDQLESTKTAISKRYSPTDEQWMTFYDDGVIIRHHTDELLNDGPIRILDRFPVTLADLLPDGCTRFECRNNAGTKVHYVCLASHALWAVSDDPMQGLWRLEEIAEQFDLDLQTLVPLQVHPDYIEARR